MSKITSVYVGMLGIFALGLWGILTSGSMLLRAPTDLAGEWTLEPAGPTTQPEKPKEMRIDQSGRFFRVSLGGREVSLKLESERELSETEGSEIRLIGEDVQMTLLGSAQTDELQLVSRGSIAGAWTAIRVGRTHPGRKMSPPTSKPA